MSICPYCEHQNIEGVDLCDECGQPLSDLYLRSLSSVERSLMKDRVRILKPKRPIAVSPGTPIRQVLRLLADNAIGCVIVVEDDQVVGIFSERDALMKLNTQAARLAERPVSEFMTPHPQTLEAGTKIAFAVQHMDQGGYRHLPIVDEDGRPTGVISVRDILRYLTDKMAGTSAHNGGGGNR